MHFFILASLCNRISLIVKHWLGSCHQHTCITPATAKDTILASQANTKAFYSAITGIGRWRKYDVQAVPVPFYPPAPTLSVYVMPPDATTPYVFPLPYLAQIQHTLPVMPFPCQTPGSPHHKTLQSSKANSPTTTPLLSSTRLHTKAYYLPFFPFTPGSGCPLTCLLSFASDHNSLSHSRRASLP